MTFLISARTLRIVVGACSKVSTGTLTPPPPPPTLAASYTWAKTRSSSRAVTPTFPYPVPPTARRPDRLTARRRDRGSVSPSSTAAPRAPAGHPHPPAPSIRRDNSENPPEDGRPSAAATGRRSPTAAPPRRGAGTTSVLRASHRGGGVHTRNAPVRRNRGRRSQGSPTGSRACVRGPAHDAARILTADRRRRLRRQNRAQHFRLLVSEPLGIEDGGRLHGDDSQQLQDVVLDHVAHDADLFVEPAAPAYAHVLDERNLDVIHIAPVPDRFEDRVGEPKYQHVLHGLLAEVVVDPVHRLLTNGPVNEDVQAARRCFVPAERFFNDDAGPRLAAAIANQLASPQVGQNRFVRGGGRGQVEEAISAGPEAGLHLGQGPGHVRGVRFLRRVGGHIEEPLRKPAPAGCLNRHIPPDAVTGKGSKLLVRHAAAGHAHDGQ